MDRRCIAAPISKSDDLQYTDTGIERDGEYITDFDPMPGRLFARAVDPNVPFRDQRRSV